MDDRARKGEITHAEEYIAAMESLGLRSFADLIRVTNGRTPMDDLLWSCEVDLKLLARSPAGAAAIHFLRHVGHNEWDPTRIDNDQARRQMEFRIPRIPPEVTALAVEVIEQNGEAIERFRSDIERAQEARSVAEARQAVEEAGNGDAGVHVLPNHAQKEPYEPRSPEEAQLIAQIRRDLFGEDSESNEVSCKDAEVGVGVHAEPYGQAEEEHVQAEQA